MNDIKDLLFAGERSGFLFLQSTSGGEEEYNIYVINIDSIKSISYDDRCNVIAIFTGSDSLLSPPLNGKVTPEEYKRIIDAICGDLTGVIIQHDVRYIALGTNNDTNKTEH